MPARGAEQDRQVVRFERAVDVDDVFVPLGVGETPDLVALHGRVDEAIVGGELARRLRLAMRFEIGAFDAVITHGFEPMQRQPSAESASLPRRIAMSRPWATTSTYRSSQFKSILSLGCSFRNSKTSGAITLRPNAIDAPTRSAMTRNREPAGSGRNWRLRSDEIAAPFGHVRLRRLELAQHELAPLEIEGADLRHADAARVAVEQARAEPPLEFGHVLRHGRLGEAQVIRRTRKTARLDDANEKLKPRQPIHLAKPPIRPECASLKRRCAARISVLGPRPDG